MKILSTLGFILLIAAIVLFALFPFYYAILSSFRPSSELFKIAYWPQSPTTANYASIFNE